MSSQSREMSQSLVVTSQGGLPLHRSSSFHQVIIIKGHKRDNFDQSSFPRLRQARMNPATITARLLGTRRLRREAVLGRTGWFSSCVIVNFINIAIDIGGSDLLSLVLIVDDRNHFYLDDDELILPIGPNRWKTLLSRFQILTPSTTNRSHGSQARLQERALYG